MDLASNGIEGNGIVSCVWREDGDCIARAQGVNRRLVGVRIASVVGRIGVETGVKTIVDLGDVLMKVLACYGVPISNCLVLC
jgi:hypothetical protein